MKEKPTTSRGVGTTPGGPGGRDKELMAKSGRGLGGGICLGAGYGDGGVEERVAHSGEAGGAAHDGTCVLTVENEAGVLEDAGDGSGFEFAGGLRRGLGNL